MHKVAIKLKNLNLYSYLLIALTLSLCTYFLYFSAILDSHKVIYSGTDSSKYFYPTRYYLSTKLSEGTFPLWTEHIFVGFPIYADIDRGLLNPLNIITTYLFGPFTSYKILHLGFYLLGSLSLFYFLRRRGLGLLEYFISNLVFFFSFFFLYHQQHQSMVLTLYSLPAVINLADLFVRKKELKLLLLNSILLALLFYFGNVQGIVLLFISLGIFIFTFLSLKKGLFYFLILGLFFGSFILPQVFPTLMLYSQSTRNLTGIVYTQGSISPSMLVNLIYPFTYGVEHYVGTLLSGDYIKHEMYIYVGFTTFIISIFGIGSMESSKEKSFIRSLVLIAVILMLVGYLPILRKINIPIISLFRYWVRGTVLLVFAFALASAYFVKLFPKIKVNTILADLIMPILLVVLSFLFNFKEHFTVNSIKFFFTELSLFMPYTLVWFIVVLVVAMLIGLIFVKRSRYLILPIILLVFIDLFYFSLYIRPDFFKSTSFFIPTKSLPSELSNSRTFFTDTYTDNFLLYKDAWGLWGYSQFEPEDLGQELSLMGIDSLKYYKTQNTTLPSIQTQLASLGIEYIVEGKAITKVPNSSLFSGVENMEFLEKTEGYFNANIETTSEGIVDTKIRYYPNWQLTIDNVPADLIDNNGFISFFLSSGTHNISLKYIPTDLYFGIKSMLTLLAFFTAAMVFFKDKIYEIFN